MKFELDLSPAADFLARLPTGMLVLLSVWAWYVPVGFLLRRRLRRNPDRWGDTTDERLRHFNLVWFWSPAIVVMVPAVFAIWTAAAVVTLGLIPFPWNIDEESP